MSSICSVESSYSRYRIYKMQKDNKIHVYYELLQEECNVKVAGIISL